MVSFGSEFDGKTFLRESATDVQLLVCVVLVSSLSWCSKSMQKPQELLGWPLHRLEAIAIRLEVQKHAPKMSTAASNAHCFFSMGRRAPVIALFHAAPALEFRTSA